MNSRTTCNYDSSSQIKPNNVDLTFVFRISIISYNEADFKKLTSHKQASYTQPLQIPAR